MTPVEWRAHYDAWAELQQRRNQFLDFHISRICAYIRNWSGKVAEKWVDNPLELMSDPPNDGPISEDDPAKASLHLISLWDAAAPHLK